MTRVPGLCALHCLATEKPSVSASSTTSGGSSLMNRAVASLAVCATSNCNPSRWKGGAVKCRNSSLLFETSTLGTDASRVLQDRAQDDDQRDQQDECAADG